MKYFCLTYLNVIVSCRYIYHRLLGHEVEMQSVRNTLPRRFGAPGLPELNASQVWSVTLLLWKNAVGFICLKSTERE